MKESELQTKVLTELRKLGVCFKVITPSMIGVPDIYFLYKGTAYHIEVKTIKGRLSLAQKTVLKLIQCNGGVPIVIKTEAELTSFVRGIKNEKNLH